MNRKRNVIVHLLLGLLLAAAGCTGVSTEPEIIWGKRGVNDGDLARPRAVAIDKNDRIYIVDFTARIQIFDREGEYLGPTWHTPDYRQGRPSGLSIDREGNLLVSDSHYSCLRIYSPEGKLLKVIGGTYGTEPGQFTYISDAIQDEDGYFYVGEFGEAERISKLDSDGNFLKCWGETGTEPGQFAHIRALAFGPEGHIYVVDACNHRIQVFTRSGELVRHFGQPGKELGEMKYPYDLDFSPDGKYLYVIEYGNHRVQKFTPEGESLGVWGGPGKEPGHFYSPWALGVDSRGRVHVLDSENHRVQRIKF